MVLERAEHAAARGATVHGRIAGYGITADGYHITGPDPEGGGQKRAMTKAVADAGLTVTDIDHVNCHATSTVAGDPGEAKAVQQALGDHVVLTAPKSALGHTVGAAGAVESIITLLSIRDGVIPATLNLEKLDPGVELDVVAGEPRKADIDAALCNSFGFGGHNVAVAITKA
jgi:3-oxoacyl-[acyl-carrier-protein] synthase II